MDGCKSEYDPKFNSLEAFRGKDLCLNPLFTLKDKILPELMYLKVLYNGTGGVVCGIKSIGL